MGSFWNLNFVNLKTYSHQRFYETKRKLKTKIKGSFQNQELNNTDFHQGTSVVLVHPRQLFLPSALLLGDVLVLPSLTHTQLLGNSILVSIILKFPGSYPCWTLKKLCIWFRLKEWNNCLASSDFQWSIPWETMWCL